MKFTYGFKAGQASLMDFPGGSDGKASAYNAGDPASVPGLGRSPGEGNGNPFQYSCLENPRDRGTWWASVYGVAESDTTEATQQQQEFVLCPKDHKNILNDFKHFEQVILVGCRVHKGGNKIGSRGQLGDYRNLVKDDVLDLEGNRGNRNKQLSLRDIQDLRINRTW